MYNLLIIDDEPLILESLYQMVLKKKKEQLYLFKATNGPAALRIFESRHIDDIVVTDESGCVAGFIDVQDLPGLKLM